MIGSGPMEDELKTMARSLSISEKIIFHSWLSKEQLREHYRRAVCLINPSFCEGMPNTVLEAMACGTPVIASDVPGNRELVAHEKTGLLFDLNSPEQFRSCLTNLLKDEQQICAMGNAGRRKAVSGYSWESSAEAYVELIRRCGY